MLVWGQEQYINFETVFDDAMPNFKIEKCLEVEPNFMGKNMNMQI